MAPPARVARVPRGAAAGRVMADCLALLAPRGRWLVVDDAPEVVLDGLAPEQATSWQRRGSRAVAWPPAGPFRGAVVRMPREREALEMVLHAAASRLEPEGDLYVYGANDEGARSVGRRLERLFEAPAETVETRRHCRVWRTTPPVPLPRPRATLADWRLRFHVEVAGTPLDLVSYPGVFAHGRLDAGSGLLIESLPEVPARSRVLDFGCGAGVVALALSRRQRGLRIDMLDVDAVALEAARENVPDARTHLGDGWSALPHGVRYRLIVSNPPLHQGRGRDMGVLERLCTGAPVYLEAGGTLAIVTRRTLPVARLLEPRFERVEVAAEDAQYRVWKASA